MLTIEPGLIRLVTARYRQMQGLATMADACFPLFCGTAFLVMADLTDGWYTVVFAVVLTAFVVARFTWIRRRIEAFYTHRYGRVVQPVAASGIGFNLCVAIGYAKIMRDLVHAPVGIQVSLMTLALCSYPLWVATRDFPYRAYWLLLAVAGAASALLLPYYQSGDVMDVWTRNAYLAIGCALFAVGALDHRLLARALRARGADVPDIQSEPS